MFSLFWLNVGIYMNEAHIGIEMLNLTIHFAGKNTIKALPFDFRHNIVAVSVPCMLTHARFMIAFYWHAIILCVNHIQILRDLKTRLSHFCPNNVIKRNITKWQSCREFFNFFVTLYNTWKKQTCKQTLDNVWIMCWEWCGACGKTSWKILANRKMLQVVGRQAILEQYNALWVDDKPPNKKITLFTL